MDGEARHFCDLEQGASGLHETVAYTSNLLSEVSVILEKSGEAVTVIMLSSRARESNGTGHKLHHRWEDQFGNA